MNAISPARRERRAHPHRPRHPRLARLRPRPHARRRPRRPRHPRRAHRRPRPHAHRRPAALAAERGDVPGWVLVTLMTAGLVVALWAVAGPALTQVFLDAIAKVTGAI